jgi:hypothetical protein
LTEVIQLEEKGAVSYVVGTGTVDGSDVEFLVDFSTHRAVDLSFFRRLHSSDDQERRSFHVHGTASSEQRRDSSASPRGRSAP